MPIEKPDISYVAHPKIWTPESRAKRRAERARRYKEKPWSYQTYTSRAHARWYRCVSTLTPAEWKARLDFAGGVCEMCQETPTTKLQLGHQRSLSGGGENSARNVVCLCSRCNQSQGLAWIDFGTIDRPVRPPKLIQSRCDVTYHIPHPRTVRIAKSRNLAQLRVVADVKDGDFSVEDILAG